MSKVALHSAENDAQHAFAYRSDIDGLRAVAILLVVAFHAFPKALTGGFVGVDVFFVISGFLISSIIFRKIENNTFCYVDFYLRRAKRIFPALIVVLVASLVLGCIVLFADEYKQLGKHVTAGVLFVSNLVLWSEAGYFDNVSDTKPLLHLWSLGIEEQFYILWPILLGITWKWKHNFLYITLLIAALSFAANIYVVDSNQVAAFYSPFTRFWELMAGGLLAYMTLYKRHTTLVKNHWFGTVGVFLILISSVLLTKEDSFPGWWALFPVIGAVFIILSGSQAWWGRKVLASRILVGIGLISYPLYLWHWVLLSFVRTLEGQEPRFEVMVAVVILSFVLAWLTYRLVELPMRYGRNQNALVGILCATMVIVGSLGYLIYKQDGLAQRTFITSLSTQADDLVYKKHWESWSPCEGEQKGCKILYPSKPPTIALIGDSHAGHLASGLGDVFKNSNENIIVKLKSSCMPFYTTRLEGKYFFTCEVNSMDEALDFAIASPSIEVIMLSGYANLAIYGRKEASVNTQNYFRGFTRSFSEQQVAQNIRAFKKAMHETLSRLVWSGKKVVFMVDIPELDFNPRGCIEHRLNTFSLWEYNVQCSMDKVSFEDRTVDYNRLMTEVKSTFPSVKFIETAKYLCKEKKCTILKDGRLLYATRDHLTTYGSRYLMHHLKKELGI